MMNHYNYIIMLSLTSNNSEMIFQKKEVTMNLFNFELLFLFLLYMHGGTDVSTYMILGNYDKLCDLN